MKTKFAIGCLVQWYESEIIEEYLDTLKEAIKLYDGDVIVDIGIVLWLNSSLRHSNNMIFASSKSVIGAKDFVTYFLFNLIFP